MTRRQAELDALLDSIHNWRENVTASEPGLIRMGAHHCALCQYADSLPEEHDNENEDGLGSCAPCPVAKRTGVDQCSHSPYHSAFVAANHWLREPDNVAAQERWCEAAQAEVGFLESLLREDEQYLLASLPATRL